MCDRAPWVRDCARIAMHETDLRQCTMSCTVYGHCFSNTVHRHCPKKKKKKTLGIGVSHNLYAIFF